MNELKLSDRISLLKKKMLSEPRYASIEQAMIITNAYKENENKPRIIQRAIALKNAMEKLKISIEPDELIVGNRTAGAQTATMAPEILFDALKMPAIQKAVDDFDSDWKSVYGEVSITEL